MLYRGIITEALFRIDMKWILIIRQSGKVASILYDKDVYDQLDTASGFRVSRGGLYNSYQLTLPGLAEESFIDLFQVSTSPDPECHRSYLEKWLTMIIEKSDSDIKAPVDEILIVYPHGKWSRSIALMAKAIRKHHTRIPVISCCDLFLNLAALTCCQIQDETAAQVFVIFLSDQHFVIAAYESVDGSKSAYRVKEMLFLDIAMNKLKEKTTDILLFRDRYLDLSGIERIYFMNYSTGIEMERFDTRLSFLVSLIFGSSAGLKPIVKFSRAPSVQDCIKTVFKTNMCMYLPSPSVFLFVRIATENLVGGISVSSIHRSLRRRFYIASGKAGKLPVYSGFSLSSSMPPMTFEFLGHVSSSCEPEYLDLVLSIGTSNTIAITIESACEAKKLFRRQIKPLKFFDAL